MELKVAWIQVLRVGNFYPHAVNTQGTAQCFPVVSDAPGYWPVFS